MTDDRVDYTVHFQRTRLLFVVKSTVDVQEVAVFLANPVDHYTSYYFYRFSIFRTSKI
jgi:hypothetical protein